jgi:glutamyl-tRNA synthetase
MPNDGQIRFTDLIRGELVFENANLDDPVLLKTDGFATYHLAAMVDDHLQGVTHVIRGDEWLPSAPKHVHLIRSFGWPMPHFAHVPVVLGKDGKKLSKRHGATSVLEFRDQGYLPEALINFLAMLGWAPGQGDEQNIFSLEQLIEKFSLEQVGASPAVFEYDKLDWMNDMHIRMLPPEDLARRLVPFLAQAGVHINSSEQHAKLLLLIPLLKERVKKLTDAAQFVDFFFSEIDTPPVEMLIGPKMEQHFSAAALRQAREGLAAFANFDDETALEKTLNEICDELKLKRAQLFTIVRNAISGKAVTPPLFGMLRVMGRDVALARIDRAVARLQGG